MSFIIFTIGLSIIAYPWIIKPFNILEGKNAMGEYYDMIEGLSPEAEKELMDEYENYNNILAGEDIEEYNGRLMGTIEIPSFKLKIPIYQGATVENLRVGVGHISGSSLPTGELGSHAVIAGHNRFRNKSLFTEIHKLEVGDNFKIDILGKAMEYEVVETIVVETYETNYLLPVEGKDKVTLMTCSNFGKRRLLVMGERKK